MARGASNDFDLSNHKPVVEGNSHIGSDYILVGWIDSSFRNLHVRADVKSSCLRNGARISPPLAGSRRLRDAIVRGCLTLAPGSSVG
jgi:hypothetical protein